MAGGLRIQWHPGPETLFPVSNLEAALAAAGVQVAERYQANAKAMHRWHNRTGAAEADLVAHAVVGGMALTVTLENAVWYGIYLEYAHGGVWGVLPIATAATLPEAVQIVSAAIMGAFA